MIDFKDPPISIELKETEWQTICKVLQWLAKIDTQYHNAEVSKILSKLTDKISEQLPIS